MVCRYHPYQLVVAGLLMLVTLRVAVASRDQDAQIGYQVEHVTTLRSPNQAAAERAIYTNLHSYEKSLTKTRVHALHIVLEVLSL